VTWPVFPPLPLPMPETAPPYGQPARNRAGKEARFALLLFAFRLRSELKPGARAHTAKQAPDSAKR
jgi:hypothetical protein